ncbi:MAG TPA: tetratricopeptide repeat protein [Bacteroidia bacterium]|jgi:serine phosphatase RsbU (regulator of sigma subunit)/Tfp pilus assembly protein PilF
MHKTLALLFCLLFFIPVYAQTKSKTKLIFSSTDIDSLQAALKTQKDTAEIITLLNLAQAVSSVDPQKSVAHLFDAVAKSKKINYRKGELKGYNNLGGIYLKLSDFKLAKRYIDTGIVLSKKWVDYEINVRSHQNLGTYYYYQQQYDSAISNYKLAYNVALKHYNDTATIGKLCNNIGMCYNLIGNYQEGVLYYSKTLKLCEAVKDEEGIILANGNIGTVYYHMKNYAEAEKYMKKGLVMALKVNNKYQISAITMNLGVVYKDLKQYDKAEEQYKKAYEVKVEMGDKRGQGMALVNMGELYSAMGDDVKALNYFKKAEGVAIEIKNYQIELYSYTSQANLYAKNNDIINASKKYESAIAIAEKLNLKPDLVDIYKLYSEATSKAGDFKKAYRFHLLYSVLKDSLFNVDNNKVIAEITEKYDSEKKQSQIELLNKDKEKQELVSMAERKKQRIITGSVSTGLLFVVILALFIFRSNRQKQKANIEITKQKEIIEEKSREVHDSITYAKRIQTAILPPDKLIKVFLPDSFVLFKPKDIVSGDFYWMENSREDSNKILFAAVDCTGHGVPGAMVSVVGNSSLNRAVREFGLSTPCKILDKLTQLVEETFERSENAVKDGMDISLCCLDKSNNILEWSGANNPIWINRKGVMEKITADKQPIGVFEHRKPFTNHSMQLEKGDLVYIFTDGYADQFGGAKGKKFKSKQLEELLLASREFSMEEQKQLLDKEFENWRSGLEQIDDVCIIGVRV